MNLILILLLQNFSPSQYTSHHCLQYLYSISLPQYGFFCYAIQAFASQVINQPQLFTDNAVYSWARSTHPEMLKIAEDCFRQALDLEGTKHAEPWIYRMMLGKIAAKLGKPCTEIIQHLAKVSLCLSPCIYNSPSILFPKKVTQNNNYPQGLPNF